MSLPSAESCPHYSNHRGPLAPETPPSIQVDQCLVLEYQGQSVLVARPDWFQRKKPPGRSYNMKTIVDVAKEAFKIPDNVQEINFYTTQMEQCYGRRVKIGDSAWQHLGDEINFLIVDVDASRSVDEALVKVVDG